MVLGALGELLEAFGPLNGPKLEKGQKSEFADFSLGDPFWALWATLGTTWLTFSPFWGVELAVCSTIAVLMAKVSGSG